MTGSGKQVSDMVMHSCDKVCRIQWNDNVAVVIQVIAAYIYSLPYRVTYPSSKSILMAFRLYSVESMINVPRHDVEKLVALQAQQYPLHA